MGVAVEGELVERRVLDAGVYISQKLDIFAPPPIFQDHIFSPKYSENFFSPLFFPPLTPYICIFS